MNLWVVALSHFLHILGTVIWVGGILMVLLVILPSAKAAIEETPMLGKLMKEVTQRFTLLANTSIFLLLATGALLFWTNNNYTSVLDQRNTWNLVIYLKILLVAAMVTIHFYRGLILNQKIAKSSTTANEAQTASLKKFSLDLVKTNLALGVSVLMLAAVSMSI